MAYYQYEYRCPTCDTYLQFKMRVTQTKRKCPHCGTPITPEEIDRQADAKKLEAEKAWKDFKKIFTGTSERKNEWTAVAIVLFLIFLVIGVISKLFGIK